MIYLILWSLSGFLPWAFFIYKTGVLDVKDVMFGLLAIAAGPLYLLLTLITVAVYYQHKELWRRKDK